MHFSSSEPLDYRGMGASERTNEVGGEKLLKCNYYANTVECIIVIIGSSSFTLALINFTSASIYIFLPSPRDTRYSLTFSFALSSKIINECKNKCLDLCQLEP
jgi:hypothetical protein